MKEYPLYESSFTIYKCSPLYNGTTPILTGLSLHARRLRDQLRANGLRSTLESSETTTYSGALTSCEWTLLGDEALWSRMRANEDLDDDISLLHEIDPSDARGVLIELTFEKATHKAILLGKQHGKTALPTFTDLPVILMRMPTALRDITLQYLRQAFDCHITPLKLQAQSMLLALDETTSQLGAEQTRDIDSMVLSKGCQVQIGFPSAAPMLKGLEMVINKNDVMEFLNIGKRLNSDRVGPALSGINSKITLGPFSATLSKYLEEHTTIRLDHPGIVLSKFACGPIMLSSEGKIRIGKTAIFAEQLWDMLIETAQGERQLLSVSVEDQSLLRQNVTKQRQIAEAHQTTAHHVRSDLGSVDRDRSPTEPPPPYEIHDPAFR